MKTKNNFKSFSFIVAVFFLVNAVLCAGVNASSSSTGYTVGIKDDTVYYLMNASSSRLLYSDTSNESDYASVCTVDQKIIPSYWSSDATKWELNRLSSGGFELYGGAGYGAMLKVIDNNTIETETYEDGTNTTFTINRSSFGTYTIMYNGYYLTENTYTHNLYLASTSSSDTIPAASYWSLMAVQKGPADLYTFTFSEDGSDDNMYDTSGAATKFLSAMETMNYNLAFHMNNHSPASDIPSFMEGDDIFIYFGCGAPGELRFYSDNYTLYGQVMANSALAGPNDHNQCYINNIPDNGLSQLRCVILLADNVGTASDNYNMVDAIYDKGAHFVLGLTESNMNNGLTMQWLDLFWTTIETGVSIQDALDAADGEYSIDYTPRGDTAQVLKMG